ncbi:MAG: hypothetical protein IJD90_00400 [Clostridia bacterium]|nr:hypothetical protein [Clostridia bacterium]
MKLFVDDKREKPDDKMMTKVETFGMATILMSVQKYEFVSLDYDLGANQPTGLDILKWMHENARYPEHINIHSDHPEGKPEMMKFIKENFPGNIIVTTNTI